MPNTTNRQQLPITYLTTLLHLLTILSMAILHYEFARSNLAISKLAGMYTGLFTSAVCWLLAKKSRNIWIISQVRPIVVPRVARTLGEGGGKDRRTDCRSRNISLKWRQHIRLLQVQKTCPEAPLVGIFWCDYFVVINKGKCNINQLIIMNAMKHLLTLMCISWKNERRVWRMIWNCPALKLAYVWFKDKYKH